MRALIDAAEPSSRLDSLLRPLSAHEFARATPSSSSSSSTVTLPLATATSPPPPLPTAGLRAAQEAQEARAARGIQGAWRARSVPELRQLWRKAARIVNTVVEHSQLTLALHELASQASTSTHTQRERHTETHRDTHAHTRAP